MKDLALPGQATLFFAEQRAAPTPADWRTIRSRGKRIVTLLVQRGGWWTLAQVREACGGSDTGNSAALRAARRQGYLLHTDRRTSGVWVYKLESIP